MTWQLIYLFTVAMTLLVSLTERHRHVTSVRWLALLLAIILLSESVSYWLRESGFNNQFIFYFYTPIELLFLTNLYANAYSYQKASLVARVIGWGFLAGCCGYFLVNAEHLQNAPTSILLAEWVLALLFVLYYFYDLYRNDYLLSLPRQPLFWISVGNFFFYSGTFFLMGLIEEVKKTDGLLAKRLFLINTFLNIALYFFWSIGFLCLRLPSRNSSSSSF